MTEPASPEHVDVLVVGAGISGIDAGYHLKTRCPDRSFVLLEGRSAIGGTWDLFRYPGIRSDSDMYTFGFGFKPWSKGKSIAGGDDILEYLDETVRENGLDRHIRFGHLVTKAEWSSATATWTVTARKAATEEVVTFTCGFLLMCSGYYSYKQGYTPEMKGRERFRGPIVHPQEWPEDLDYRGKRVVVIGSGATAVTLVPAMAEDAGHVVMLQRSPAWVVSRPDRDRIADGLRQVLPEKAAYRLVRFKNAVYTEFMYKLSRRCPQRIKARLLRMVREELGKDYDVERHFTPRYDPWDQRLCLVPNSDLFAAIRSGRASVVTDTIDTLTEDGILLRSGEPLRADVIVTATGLQMVTLGEVDFEVDGEAVDFSQTWAYRGLAYSGVPNLASLFGYVNASWTLRADLVCEYVCRILNHMQESGSTVCVPRLRPSDADMDARPWVEDFTPGYVQRALSTLPRQGDREPWRHPQSYSVEKKAFRKARIDDGVLQFR